MGQEGGGVALYNGANCFSTTEQPQMTGHTGPQQISPPSSLKPEVLHDSLHQMLAWMSVLLVKVLCAASPPCAYPDALGMPLCSELSVP